MVHDQKGSPCLLHLGRDGILNLRRYIIAKYFG
jgi:hypothetical protein